MSTILIEIGGTPKEKSASALGVATAHNGNCLRWASVVVVVIVSIFPSRRFILSPLVLSSRRLVVPSVEIYVGIQFEIQNDWHLHAWELVF